MSPVEPLLFIEAVMLGVGVGGCSLVVSPDGTVITQGPSEESVVIAELDPAKYSKYDFLSNLRLGVYSAERMTA